MVWHITLKHIFNSVKVNNKVKIKQLITKHKTNTKLSI